MFFLFGGELGRDDGEGGTNRVWANSSFIGVRSLLLELDEGGLGRWAGRSPLRGVVL